MSPPRVLVVARDRLDGPLGGTAIRSVELARALGAVARVTLAGAGGAPSEREGIPCVAYDAHHPSALAAALRAADIAVSFPAWPPVMRTLRASGARLVFDLYVPAAVETVGGFPGQDRLLRRVLSGFAVDRTVEALAAGDYLICASERQRDLYIGMLLAERRLSTDDLTVPIGVVPFGLPDRPPVPSGAPAARGVLAGVGPGDQLVLWNGGIWPWLDPQTAIHAVGLLARTHPHVRLVFMGAATQVPARAAAARARELASRLDLLGRHVFFHDGWVPYDDRGDWLLEADVALLAHHDHLETRFAFRTRLLDCFWSGLPIVCSSGDELAGSVARTGAGVAFPPGDAPAAAAGLARVLGRGRAAYAAPLAALAERHRWSTVAAPLVDYVAAPPPPRRGSRRPARRPAHLARALAFGAARGALDAVGLRDRPRL